MSIVVSYNSVGQSAATCPGRADAEKILGESATLASTSSEIRDLVPRTGCTWTANQPDVAKNVTGHLYFLSETYATEADAHKVFQSFYTQNMNNAGIEKMKDASDEGFMHTDGQNFQLVIIRKGNKLIRLKVNKITSHTAPLSSLQSLGKKIASGL